jgi:hypothetical protein
MLAMKGKNWGAWIRADSALAGLRIVSGATSTNGAVPTTGLGVVSQARIEQSFPAGWPCASHLLLSFCSS